MRDPATDQQGTHGKVDKRMKIRIVIAMMAACLVVSGNAWAQAPEAAKTEGLSSVKVTTGQGAGAYTGYWFYDFALINNTSTTSPLNDGTIDYAVLIDRMVVDQTFLLPAPTKVTSARGWTWSPGKWERFVDTQNEKYNVGPSAGPGQTLTGFRYYYAGILPVSPVTGIVLTNHVLAVNPIPTGPFVYANGDMKGESYFHYAGVTVNLPGYGNQNTWWDKPGDGNVPVPPDIPEASAVVLGALGLLGPMGYALKRKRVSK